ncbi:hypothetical protein UFOVP1229_28 [uncultured Caudovirales phage]|uniref:Uncharacterized protein n=1 Tax=uncultured Caudovirales phage TaxID=2100421 RepID=A0A6J5RA32_9CAUD|nr:hypothetical protein UFOVP1229_28 [uncultured Caudovirales phage]
MTEKGPIYGVELIDTLPLGKSGMLQQMPGRDELASVHRRNPRVANGYEVLLAHYLELRKQSQVMEAALKKISTWFGEFPDTGRTWEDGTPMSYVAAFGSNGERDYMRSVAQAALEEARIDQ